MNFSTDTSFVRSVKCSDAYTESVADFSLPDYLSDVRRILFTEASICPSGRFLGGDDVEFSGIVVYKVVYLDSEGAISSVEFSSDYDYSVKCSSDGYKDSVSDTKLSAYTVRLLGPRRFSARSTIVGSVRISEEASLPLCGSAFEGDESPELNKKSVKIRTSSPSSVTEREYAEEIVRLDGAIADEVSVVYSFAEPLIESVVAEDGEATLRGRLKLVCSVKNADTVSSTEERTVNIEEKVSFENFSSDMNYIPEISVTSLKTTVNADESGCAVVMNAILEFCLIGEHNSTLDVATDGYLKSCPTENSYESFTYSELVSVAPIKGNHNSEMSLSDVEGEKVDKILFITAVPKLERVEYTLDNITLLGEVRYSGVGMYTTDSETGYVPIKNSSPFAVNISHNCHNTDNLHSDIKISAHGVWCEINESKIVFGCSLDGNATVYEDKCERILSACNARSDEKYDKSNSVVTVYYPTDEDTLFSVAKRFRTSSLKIARDNDIAEAVFSDSNPDGKLFGVKKLIIY